MEQKDPKDMTVSELMRVAANRVEMEGNSQGAINCLRMTVGVDDEITYPKDLAKTLSALADKIDAELAQARRSGLERAAKSWAKANGWPDFREGEDFGAWLDRCTYKKPVDDCNEPVQFGDEIELHYLIGGADKGRFQEVTVNRGPVWMLSFTGVDHERLYRYDSECDILKRPAPEVLGADGLPIKVGDVMWSLSGAGPLTVTSLHTDDPTPDGGDSPWADLDDDGLYSWIYAGSLTHTPPDTQERIDEDALKSCIQYWGCNDLSCGKCPALIDGKKPVEFYELDPIHGSCHEAQKLDLLRRQRELDAKGGE